jgi:hypothetical protein
MQREAGGTARPGDFGVAMFDVLDAGRRVEANGWGLLHQVNVRRRKDFLR